jgi:conjugal transfer pilus assembly protein TraL
MSEDAPISIPDLVDEPPHFLIWQIDEVISIAVGLIIGLLFNAPIYGILFGVFVRSKYIKIRDGKPKGFIMHRIRSMGLILEKNEHGTAMQSPLVKKFHQ